MLTLRLFLLIAAVVAPFVSAGAVYLRDQIILSASITNERNAGITACNRRVATIEDQTRKAVAIAVAEAQAAEDAITDTPEGRELVALCNRSASCRSRGMK